MSDDARNDVTQLLDALDSGDASAEGKLIDLVYQELRRNAVQLMRNERPGHTLQPTALVHESFLRLLKGNGLQNLCSRAHFFGAAAQAMRQVLVEHARARATVKRGGDRQRHVHELFLAALAMSSDERAAYLKEQCAGEAALREEIDQLLAHAARAETEFLEPGQLNVNAIVGDPRSDIGQ
jgi:RNA polymerase sigma factor (TIGR02999 family)